MFGKLNLILVLIIYFLVGLYFLEFFQYAINSDGVALLSIANSLKNGYIKDAINACWGITSEFLLTPFLTWNFGQPLYLVKIQSLIMGGVGF